MTCLHPVHRIDGIYEATDRTPKLIAWTCLSCGTSGASPLDEMSEDERQEAIRAERRTADRIESEELLAKLRVAGL